MYISYSVTDSVWPGRFGSVKWDEAVKTKCPDVPDEVLEEEKKVTIAIDPLSMPVEATKPNVRINEHWDPKSRAPWARELMAQLVEDGLDDDLIVDAEIEI